MKTVRTKIIAGFSIVLIIGLMLGIAGIIALQTIQRVSAEQDELNKASFSLVSVVNAHYTWKHNLIESAMNGTEFTGSLDPAVCALGNWLNGDIAKMIADPELHTMLAKIKSPHDFIHHEAANVKKLIAAGKTDEAKTIINANILPKTDETISILTEMENRYMRFADEKADEMSRVENLANIIIILLILVAVAAGICISLLITAGIEKNLRIIITDLNTAAANITAEIQALNETSDYLANGSSRQAAAIEETSATMNETASMVAQNAENTRVAEQIAVKSTAITNEAGKHMTSMMSTMGELIESSKTVSKIIKTIDDIAFQTNLLAINATVEAARAGGDAGRSFAVVAEEVRNLAQKSAKSVTDTTNIIERNIKLTGEVNKQAGEVANLAQKSAEQMAELEKLVEEISAASEEQANGINQVNIAVSSMENVTQKNAALAEENSATATSMKAEIAKLDEAVYIATNLVSRRDD